MSGCGADTAIWEERYGADPDDWFFGREPSELGRLTVHFVRMLRPGEPIRAIDLGCGEGRDAVYFAEQGWAVSAVDASPAGIAKALRLADERGVRFSSAEAADVRHADLTSHNVLFSGNCIQALGEGCPAFLGAIQSATPVGGINSVRVFTNVTDAFAGRTDLYRFGAGELRERYEGWRLLYSSEDLLFVPHADGLASFAGIIAQKV